MDYLGRFPHEDKPTYNQAMPEGHLTVREVADRLGVDESRVRALIRAGKLKAERVGKRLLLVKANDLAEFEATRNRKPGRPKRSGN